MNQILSFLPAVIIGTAIGLFVLNRKKYNFNAITFLNAEDFRNNMRKGQLIDIRKKEKYDKEKINGARNFPKQQIGMQLSKLRKDSSVFIYCENGRKSYKVAKKLIKKNISPIYVLKDGFDEWPYNKK